MQQIVFRFNFVDLLMFSHIYRTHKNLIMQLGGLIYNLLNKILQECFYKLRALFTVELK